MRDFGLPVDQRPRLLRLLLAVAAALIAILLLAEEVHRHLTAIEAWVAGLGPWGPLAFVALFVIGTSLLVPESVLMVIAGTLFGLAEGGAVAVAGSLLAAGFQYALARRLLRGRIRAVLAAKPQLAAIERAVRRDETRLQWLLRLTPLSPTLISYLLGAAGVRFGGFLLACLAQLPQLFLELYLGHAGRHLASLAGDDGHPARLHDLALFGGLGLAIGLVVLLSQAARQAVAGAMAESAPSV